MPRLLHRMLLAFALFFCMVAPAHAARAKAVAGPAKTEAKPAKAKSGKAKAGKANAGKSKAKAGKAAKPKAEVVRRRIAKGTMTLRNLNTRDKLEGLRVVEVSKKGKKELARLSPKGKKKLGWMLRDFRNGKVVWKQLAGTGYLYDNDYAATYIGPDGTFYVGANGGIVAMKDGSAK